MGRSCGEIGVVLTDFWGTSIFDDFLYALKDIKKEISDPYSDSSMVLYGYIKAKLYLNTNKLDPLILEQNLKNKISTELLNRVVLLAKICDAGRFSPESSQLKDDIKVEITNLLKDLDRSL